MATAEREDPCVLVTWPRVTTTLSSSPSINSGDFRKPYIYSIYRLKRLRMRYNSSCIWAAYILRVDSK